MRRKLSAMFGAVANFGRSEPRCRVDNGAPVVITSPDYASCNLHRRVTSLDGAHDNRPHASSYFVGLAAP